MPNRERMPNAAKLMRSLSELNRRDWLGYGDGMGCGVSERVRERENNEYGVASGRWGIGLSFDCELATGESDADAVPR